jgi:hypothetical protein
MRMSRRGMAPGPCPARDRADAPSCCDIATSLEPNGRPRIEQERTVHRQLNQGQSPAWVAAANAQLQAYLQVAVQDYCASGR